MVHPGASLLIGFYTEGLPFDGATIYEKGLGGSESALYFLAREFAGKGHRVQVFCHTRRPGRYEDVEYRHLESFPAAAAQQVFDVFIVSRFPRVFTLPFQSRLKVMWNHDNLVEPQTYRRETFRADLFLTLSAYHEAEYLSQLPELSPFCHRTKNGVDLEMGREAILAAGKDMTKVVYASRPERGLEILLRHIWPRLLQARPELQLSIMGYEAPNKPGQEHMAGLVAGAPRTTVLGSLAKPDFYRHLAEAALLLYPCSFPEISCIVALEAQALGTPIITSRDFALTETVGVPRYLISGRPAFPAYQEAFIARALLYLDDRDRYHQDTSAALRWVTEHYSWNHIADEWLELFSRHLAREEEEQLSYSLFLGSEGVTASFPAPPPTEVRYLTLPETRLDFATLKPLLEEEARGEWLLLLEDAGLSGSLPPLQPLLDASSVDWFGFRREPQPPGHWSGVLFRRHCPLLPDNGLEVVIP
ncbi:MAG: glycosyltransferase family 4 protein [Deltaproteobacteria bacterium]|nr:glycosyltransferase family 4 protein [Deltaproteobacteria bacterium]